MRLRITKAPFRNAIMQGIADPREVIVVHPLILVSLLQANGIVLHQHGMYGSVFTVVLHSPRNRHAFGR